jgi:DNA primase
MREDDAIAGKYINSPETPIYNKSRVLFGLFHSKDFIRQEDDALMVEGYADLISLYQAGIQNVVASSGTALTEEQLTLIGRFSKNLTLVYDADTAGSSATVRGIDLALEHDLNVRVVELPEGEDPDSFVQKHGGKEFKERLANAISFIDFKAKQFQRAGAFATAEGKTQAVRSLVQSIAKMKDELKRNFYVKEVAEKYEVYESLLFRELEQILKQGNRPLRPAVYVNPPAAQHSEKFEKTDSLETKSIPVGERDILKLILEGNPEVIRYIFSNISLHQFSDERAKNLAQHILDIYDVRGIIDVSTLINELEDVKMRNFSTELMFNPDELRSDWEKMEKEIPRPEPMTIARDAILQMQKAAIKRAKEENSLAMKEAERQHLDTSILSQRQNELSQLLNKLEKGKELL